MTRSWPRSLSPAAILIASSLFSVVTIALAAPGSAADENPLAFDMPAPDVLDDSERLVFAHYFPPFPISLDNEPADVDYYSRAFLAVDGENGAHERYGGFLRQRPIPRPVDPDDDWELTDMKTEVQRAAAAGIDGFTYDILGLTGDGWNRLLLLLEAAEDVDPAFDIMLMPDANTRTVSDPVALADALASVADHPSVYRLDDGRLVVSPFLAERVGAQWWKDFIDLMSDRGIEVAFVPLFLDYTGNIEAFADFSYGISVWGGRSPGNITNLSTSGEDARERGLIWMQPVALQDVRPKSGVFDEANNTETLRTMWSSATATGAEWVQLVTWNDYSEHTEIAPSTNTGWSPLDINAYYIVDFKTGEPPEIVNDRIYLSHRVHPLTAEPTGGQTSLMKLRSGSSPGRDTVEVLTFLRFGADVEVTIGENSYSYRAPAGVHAELFPLSLGTVSAEARSDDGHVSAVTSPSIVTDQPDVQDLQYHFASSGREGLSTRPSTNTVPDSTSEILGVPDTDESAPTSAQPDVTSTALTDPVTGTDDDGGSTPLLLGVAAVVAVIAVAIALRRNGRRPDNTDNVVSS